KKLVGRAESIQLQRKWRYCFSNYTTGRVEDSRVLRGFNRGSRPLFGSGRSAQQMNTLSSGNGLSH
ncbi:hypothetical protein, partial [Companilactobacillus huachuanensis]|uniref:hypothetical protein n=1 Tax=Companilactobacillus huachuanensis TaxID=2559914 RepID=UPI001CC643B2